MPKSKPGKKRNKFYNKLFVDNIPPYASCDQLRDYFSQFASLKKITIARDKKGASLCHAYIFFRSKQQMMDAVKTQHWLNGYSLECHLVKKTEEVDWKKKLRKYPKRRTFIQNFNFNTISKEDLIEYFEENFGGVCSVTVNYNSITMKYDNFGCVYFREISDASKALQVKSHTIQDQEFSLERFEGSRSNKYRHLRRNGFIDIFRPPIGFNWDHGDYSRERLRKMKNSVRRNVKKFENYRLNFGDRRYHETKQFFRSEGGKEKFELEPLKIFVGNGKGEF